MSKSNFHIDFDELSEEQQEVVELIGLDNFKTLMREFGGSSIYIPKTKKSERKSRNECIRSEFNGYNFKELAAKYDLTDVWVRQIVADMTKKERAKPIDGQIYFSDMPD